jgi:hypothetical protein
MSLYLGKSDWGKLNLFELIGWQEHKNTLNCESEILELSLDSKGKWWGPIAQLVRAIGS